MERNPYAPPGSRVDDTDAPRETGEVASRGRRFVNMLVDFGGYMALSMLVGIALAIAYPSGLIVLARAGSFGDYAVGIVLLMLYYLPLEALFGRTLGKMLTGTRVTNEAGGRPTFGQVLGRTAARFIPFEAFSFLSSEVGLHDRLSGTRVVRVRRH